MTFLNYLTEYFDIIIRYTILAIEAISVGILLFAVGRALWELFRREPLVRLHLAEGIALTLEFKLCSELLYTIIARQISELFIVAIVVLLRAALAFLIHWEIKIEKKNREPQKESASSDENEKTSE